MLIVIHFTISLKILCHFNFDGSSMSQKQVGVWQQKAGKVRGIEWKHLEEDLVTNQVNWLQVSDMKGLKEHLVKAESSEVKMGSGSVWDKLHLHIVQEIQSNGPQQH